MFWEPKLALPATRRKVFGETLGCNSLGDTYSGRKIVWLSELLFASFLDLLILLIIIISTILPGCLTGFWGFGVLGF